jgi:uncharacterized repeat protein (TIGR01451 family)/fimbrial isopeptide formation D2 family protein
VLVLGTVGLGAWGATMASAAPLPAPTASIALQQTGGAYGDADEKPFILAGEDATFDVSLTNSAAGAGGYNVGFTLLLPNDIDFVSSGALGSPVVYASGATLPNSSKTPPLPTVPNGSQLWVFEDVSDLPATADYSSTLTVRPRATTFPVGAAPSFQLNGYVSSDPALKPVFDGSTGVGGAAALAETSSGVASTTVPVQALRLTKHEPSPEIELLRGVHDHQTQYTLTVENTPQGDTSGVTIVDYLPAGLEFLACATVDNTDASPLLYGASGALGGTLEYPGSDSVAGAAPADCLPPALVETVDSGIPAGLEPGVYTKVTWNLPALEGRTAQSFPAAAGTPGTYVLRYAAAVPLFENTMSFVTSAGSSTPAPESLEQAANLNNNNGASTRQGQPDGYNDGIEYTNSAAVAGTYGGLVAAEPDRAASDTDTERIQAMDMRILKSVDTGNGAESNEFATGELARFTLDIATSEYTGADEMTVVDTFPNGLCPSLPVGGAEITGDPLPADCAYPSTAAGATLTGADVTAIDYDQEAGTFALTYRLTPGVIPASGSHQVVYTSLMRADYDTDLPYTGPTSSGDSMTNVVEIEGTTDAIPGLSGVTNGSGVPADGEEDDWDDSASAIVSTYSQIQKQVLPRGAVVDTAPATPTAADSCDVAPGAPWQQDQDAAGDAAFHLGDVVCYELTVDYAEQIDVRNPHVTDFLPAGVDFDSWSLYTGPNGTTGIDAADVQFSQSGKRLDWLVGEADADGDRIVGLGSRLVIHVLGVVTSMTPNSNPVLDKPQNLMKYQQENVLGDVYFLRDASAIQTGQGPTLLKGVEDVDGAATLPAREQSNPNGTVFDSDRDGIQAVQGDVVTYRVDLTGGDTAVQDMTVWDALPPGITKAQVSVTSPSATVYDPSDAGYPTSVQAAYAGRSVIVWTGIDVGVAAQQTLRYDVTIPAGARINTTYPNTAAITGYDVLLNSGETETFYPGGSLDTTPRPTEQTVSGQRTRDDSVVFLPPAVLAKDLVSTEVGPVTNDLDPNNANDQATQGELMTWRYSVTVPGDTTVANGVLSDRGVLTGASAPTPFVVESGSWSASAGVDTTGFGFEANPSGARKGVLTFPATYTNNTTSAQVFTVELTGYVGDVNPATLTNFADFTSASWNDDDPATVRYIEPNPVLTKTANPSGDVVVGDDVQYSISVANAGTRPKSYDNVIVDTVPEGLLVDTSSFAPAPVAFDPGVANGDGGTITWNVAEMPATATLGYTAQIDPTAGGGEQYVNTAAVNGFTLPSTLGGTVDDRRGERSDDDDATITAIEAGIAKGVRLADTADAFAADASAPIGDTVEYEVVVALRANINYYDPEIADALPAGVQLQSATIEGPTPDPATGIAGEWDFSLDGAANEATWDYDGDILSAPIERTLTLRYAAVLTDEVPSNDDDLDNTADFTWNTGNDDESTRRSIDDSAQVTVLNPALAIDKAVSDATPNPGEEFEYTLDVTNTGDTAAHNLVVSDVIPVGVVVDPASVSDGGVITGSGANGGGTIEWRFDAAGAENLEGPLYPETSASEPRVLTLTYAAKLAESAQIADAETFRNVASVDHFESFPEGGRGYDPTDVDDDAVVDPAFPNVTLEKTVTGSDIAYAEQPFGWTLALRNTGDGPAQAIEATDVLPANWTFDAGSARISRGGAAPVALADPTVSTVDGVQTLVWSRAQVSASTPALPAASASPTDPTRAIVITFTATPTEEALEDAGVTGDDGTPVAHVNRLSAETSDTSGATSNESGSYTGPDDTAEAFIHSANLVLDKTASTDPLVAGGDSAAAWTIQVSNEGPDAAVGPIRVLDTWGDAGDLPDGFTVTGYSGEGWSCAPSISDEGFECVRSDPDESLEAGAVFPEITVTARAAADLDPATAPVNNTATVTAGTFDPTDDNTDSDEVPVTFEADLQMVKTGPATAPNAGGPISWALTVTNLGAADSRSVSGDQITVTDVIPAGVKDATVATLPEGWTSDAAEPLQAGDTLTLTLEAGRSIPATQSVAVALTATVDPALTPGTEIVNGAAVDPGATEDPDLTNNEDDTTVTPTTDTTLSAAKTRMVLQGGTWVEAAALSPVPPVVPGDPVTYLVTVANTGTANARAVTVADEVADYLAYGSFESVEGTWTRASTASAAGDDQTFALTGPLAPGAAASFRITLTVDPEHTGAVANAVVADAENTPPAPADDDSDSERSANLSIVKSHSGAAVAGQTLPYTLIVTNEGPSYSSGPITITDTLPAGFGYVADTASVAVAGAAPISVEPVVTGQVLTWAIDDDGFALENGAQIVVSFTSSIAADVLPGEFVNTGAVDGPDDTDPLDDSNTDPVEVTTSADVSIVKTVAAGPYIAGESASYTLTVSNAGPSVARNVSVADLLPEGLTLTAIAGDGWTCDLEIGSCVRPELAPGTATITLTAAIASTVVQDAELENVATATASTPDPDPSDNTDTEVISVDAEADLQIAKTAVDAEGTPLSEVVAGTEVRYLLEVTNNGPSDAVGALSIEDTLPDGFTFVRVADAASSWTCATQPSGAGEILCLTQDGLAAGATAEDLVVVVAIDPAQPAGPAVNTATVSSPTTETNPGNNTDEATVEVVQEVDLSIVKSHEAGAVRIGDELTFDLAVENAGASDATSVTVIDTLPAGLEYVAAAGSDPAWTVGATPVAADGTTRVTATLTGSLPAGASAPALRVTVMVHPEAYAAVVNLAEVTASQTDTDPSDNAAQDSVTVPPLASLVVDKSAVGAFQAGSDAAYTITVTNDGPTEDPGPVVVTDALPSGMVFRSADAEGATCAEASGTISCGIDGPLGVGETVTIDLTVGLQLTAYPEVVNTATVASPTEQTPGAVLTDSATTPVAAKPLPATGSEIPSAIAALALVMLGLGVVLVASRRRLIQ